MGFRSRLRRDLRYSSLDAFLNSVAVGAGESFLPAFALAIGCGEIAAGFIAAVPLLAGAFLQLWAPRFFEKAQSSRTLIVRLAFLQALSYIPLLIFALRGERISDGLLFAVVTIYWFSGLAGGPAWNSWMVSLVPPRVRPRYFARRNRFSQFGLLLGLVSGGLLLHFAKGPGFELQAFAVLFAFSALSRLFSSLCLAQQSESASACVQRRVAILGLVRRLGSGSDGCVIGFMLLFCVAVNMAGQFFTPYMLKQLGLGYGPYMALIASTFVAKIIAFHWMGESARRSTPFGLMRAGAFGVALLPVLWMVSSGYGYLFFVHVVTGAVWAAYDLGVTLVLFHAIRDEERTSFLSFYNFASACAVLLGAAAGGECLKLFGETPKVYLGIFAVSAVARFMGFAILVRLIRRMGAEAAVALPKPVVVMLETVRSARRSPSKISKVS
jgi:MFS family permease